MMGNVSLRGGVQRRRSNLCAEIASGTASPRNDTYINVRIEGAGIAGQVLHRELEKRGIASSLHDRVSFPREKVCGGVLQWDSWQYLKAAFQISEPVRLIHSVSHFWRGKKISNHSLPEPMVYISRWALDETLYSRQRSSSLNDPDSLRVNAKGIPVGAGGEWIGFQAACDPVQDLEMHYGRGICVGISPTLGPEAHLAFIVKRERFRNAEDLKKILWEELRLKFDGPLKGTGRIHYGYSRESLAVGDAKMVTFPFLGLGMKHAIFSARLLAEKISTDEAQVYDRTHRHVFRRWRLFSAFIGAIYDSPFQFLLRPLIRNRALFFWMYRWLHRDGFGVLNVLC